MSLFKRLIVIFLLSVCFLSGSFSTYGQGLPMGDRMYDMKRSDLKGFEFLRKREWLKKVIDDAQNLKQEIASKDGKEQKKGRIPASALDQKNQQEWEREIDLLLREE